MTAAAVVVLAVVAVTAAARKFSPLNFISPLLGAFFKGGMTTALFHFTIYYGFRTCTSPFFFVFLINLKQTKSN